ncbi:hypothetical protein [Desulfotruncus alcoholivorax]|uniref:hypothetical protein n=1 Tax=Desulfotruncus alcoholivorax TaxID=265477 RepID=UPI000423A8C4|nr:hypothetical protein [Desulfotruncus alcoholivorax]
MPDLLGQNTWKDRVRQLEETDPAAPSTWDPIHQDLINNDVYLKTRFDATKTEVENARGGYANLDARLDQMELETLSGTGNFAGPTGATVTHNLGHTNYRVRITPTQNPGGYLGEVWVVKAANTFVVYNSGKWTGGFDYQILT